MGRFRLRLPESLHKQVKALAEQEGVSVNQFVTTALAEKLSALMTKDYLAARAAGPRVAVRRRSSKCSPGCRTQSQRCVTGSSQALYS